MFRCGKPQFGDFCLAFPKHSRMFSYFLSNLSFKWNPLSIKNNLEAFLNNIVLFNAHRVQAHHFSSPGLTENAASSAGSAPASAPPPQAESGMFALNFLKSSTMAQQNRFIYYFAWFSWPISTAESGMKTCSWRRPDATRCWPLLLLKKTSLKVFFPNSYDICIVTQHGFFVQSTWFWKLWFKSLFCCLEAKSNLLLKMSKDVP